MNLPKDQRDKLEDMENELSKMEDQAKQNLNEDSTKVELSLEELEGLPADVLSGLEKVPGKEATHRFVSMKKNEIEPAMRLIKDTEVRGKLAEAKE